MSEKTDERVALFLNIVRELDEERLREVNEIVVKEIRYRVKTRNESARTKFRVGDKVTFDAGRRGVKHGVVFAIGTGKIQVKVVEPYSPGGYMNWRVPPTMLSLEKEALSDKA